MRLALVKAVALTGAVVGAQAVPAAAQGFLQQLFGLGSSGTASPAAQPPSAPLLTPGGRPYALPGALSYGNAMSRRPLNPDDDEHEARSSAYRTICVRMCDGFYFPISNNVSKRGLYRDGMKCRAQCGEEARVYYLPAKTTDVDGATDLQGRQYGRLNTAYVYRKTLIAGCQCKPDPWSETELARHQAYADADQDKKAAGLTKTATAAAPEADAPGGAETATPDDPQRTADAAPTAKLKNPWRTTTARAAPKPTAQRAPQQVVAQGGAFSGGMGLSGGLSGGSMTWPGDTPRRP